MWLMYAQPYYSKKYKMPSSVKKGVVTIEKLYGGFAPQFTAGLTKSVEGITAQDAPGYQQYADATGVMLNRPGREGHISPGLAFDTLTDSSNRVNQTPLNVSTGSNVESFVRLRNDRMVQFGSDDVIDATYTITAAAPNHAGHVIATSDNSDIWRFVNNAGTELHFYSWEDDVDGDVGIIDTAGGGQDDDFFSTRTGGAVLTKGVPLKLWTGPDRKVYVTNGAKIGAYDPVANRANANALDFGGGMITTSGCLYGNYSAIVGYRVSSLSPSTASESKLWLWDGFSPSFNFVYDIEDFYVSKVLNRNGQIYVYTYGANNTLKLKRFTGEGFEILAETPLVTAAPLHGAVDVYLNHIIAGNSTGEIFQYGSPNDNTYPQGFHSVSALNDVGMVKNMRQNILYIGDHNGSAYTIQKTNLAKFKTGGSTSCYLKTLVYPLPTYSNITGIKVYLSQFGSGASLGVAMFNGYTDQDIRGTNDLVYQNANSFSILSFANLGATQYIYIPITIPSINSFYMIFTFNHVNTDDAAAIVRKVEVEYEYAPNV